LRQNKKLKGMEMTFKALRAMDAGCLTLLAGLAFGAVPAVATAAENQGITKDEILLGSVLVSGFILR